MVDEAPAQQYYSDRFPLYDSLTYRKGYHLSLPDKRETYSVEGGNADLRKNMKNQHDWADGYDLRQYRKGVETVNSQLESMGINRLRARPIDSFFIKVQASLIALWYPQAIAN